MGWAGMGVQAGHGLGGFVPSRVPGREEAPPRWVWRERALGTGQGRWGRAEPRAGAQEGSWTAGRGAEGPGPPRPYLRSPRSV